MRLSKSKIGMYKQCPYRYLRSAIERWRPKTIPAQLKKGIEVHEHMEHATKGAKTIQDVKENIQKRVIAKEQVADVINFFNWQKKRKLPLYIEEKFFNKELNLAGIVDRVDMDENGKLTMIDYKTGKGKWKKNGKPDWKYYRFELALYTYLFEAEHNQKISNWGVYFTTKDKYIVEPVIREEIIKAVEEVIRVRKLIQASMDNKDWPKNNTYLCRWCELFQNNECDCGCKKEHDNFDSNGEFVI